MLPKNYQVIATKNNIDRGVYHDGAKNIFCLSIGEEIICQSHSAYSVTMTLSSIGNMLATINNIHDLERKAEERDHEQRTQTYNH